MLSSVGHVRDLLKSRLSVDIDNNFEPEYRVPNEKRATVKELAAAAAGAEEIYLATDPDREGEAIAWHLVAAADMPADKIKRVVFHEITDGAVADAFANPRDINMHLVDAQQARRILDRLVGYQVSPLLWSKVRNGLSAGPRAERRPAHRRRARAGNHGVQARRALDYRRRVGKTAFASRRALQSPLEQHQGQNRYLRCQGRQTAGAGQRGDRAAACGYTAAQSLPGG